MQTFTYLNLRGQSAVFGSDPPYIFEKVKGMGAADLEIAESAGAYQQGHTIHRLQRGPRVLSLNFHIDGRPDQRTLYQHRQDLLGILSPRYAFDEATGATGRLIYQNDQGRWWTFAIPDSPRFERRLAQFMVSCPVAFRCPSPFWYSMGQSTMTLEMSEGGFRLPFRLPFRLGSRRFSGTASNGGQVDAPLDIEIHGTGEMPSLVNHSTGAVLGVRLQIPVGAVLFIRTDPEDLAVTLTRPDGGAEDAYGYLSLDSALSEFALRPGLNDIEYQPSRPSLKSRVRISWYTRLEGV